MGDHTERRRRAAQRASWPVHRHALGEEPDDDLAALTTPEERLAMMWELSRSAWLLSGREIPTYDRDQAPGRVIRSRS